MYVALAGAYVLLHYLFVSQTAHVLALFGVFLGVGVKLGVPAAPLAFLLLFASNFFSVITPQGSSANLLFTDSGYLSQKDAYRLGALATASASSSTWSSARRGCWSWRGDERRDRWTTSSTALRQNPELAIFLTLALGFLDRPDPDRVVQRWATSSARCSPACVIGQLDIEVAPIVKIVFFDLFLFATGYKVGPQFFRGLKKNALPQVALTVVLCVTSLAMTVTRGEDLQATTAAPRPA